MEFWNLWIVFEANGLSKNFPEYIGRVTKVFCMLNASNKDSENS